jgi:hypothetical protein
MHTTEAFILITDIQMEVAEGKGMLGTPMEVLNTGTCGNVLLGKNVHWMKIPKIIYYS